MNTPNLIASIAAVVALVPLASPASVTLTFDSDTEGVVLAGQGISVTHSAYNGGSVAVEVAQGFNGQAALINLNLPALSGEFQNALLYGGTIGYTIYVEQTDIVGANPGWFEVLAIANSSGIYDQEWGGAAGQMTLYGGDFPLTGTASFIANIPIVVDTVNAEQDGQFQYSTPSAWYELWIGVNSGDATFTSATFHLDDFTITANVPEPSVALLAGLGCAGLLLRRRTA